MVGAPANYMLLTLGSSQFLTDLTQQLKLWENQLTIGQKSQHFVLKEKFSLQEKNESHHVNLHLTNIPVAPGKWLGLQIASLSFCFMQYHFSVENGMVFLSTTIQS